MNYYGMIVRYSEEYSEVITFTDRNAIFSSHDIVQCAIRRGLLEQMDADRVRLAQSIGKKEYIKGKLLHTKQP